MLRGDLCCLALTARSRTTMMRPYASRARSDCAPANSSPQRRRSAAQSAPPANPSSSRARPRALHANCSRRSATWSGNAGHTEQDRAAADVEAGPRSLRPPSSSSPLLHLREGGAVVSYRYSVPTPRPRGTLLTSKQRGQARRPGSVACVRHGCARRCHRASLPPRVAPSRGAMRRYDPCVFDQRRSACIVRVPALLASRGTSVIRQVACWRWRHGARMGTPKLTFPCTW